MLGEPGNHDKQRSVLTDTLRAIVAQGARRLTVNFADVPRPEGTQLFAASVLPHL